MMKLLTGSGEVALFQGNGQTGLQLSIIKILLEMLQKAVSPVSKGRI
ncbi:hypothetical protein MKX50_00585 [Paenibacillus sp. FSL W8-0186]|nr:hypothetical protein [Paenibacillus woosongensis]